MVSRKPVTFAPGESQQVVPIPILEDEEVEGTQPEQIELLLADAQTAEIGFLDAATLEIVDDDLAIVSIAAMGSPLEESAVPGMFAIARSKHERRTSDRLSPLG